MIRRVQETASAIWFFLKFAFIILAGYGLLLGLLWLLQHPLIIELRQGSVTAVDMWARLETAVKAIGGLFLVTWLLRFLDQFFLRNKLTTRLGILSGSAFPLISIFTFPFVHGNYIHLLGNTPLLLLFAGIAIFILPRLTMLVVVALTLFLVQGIGVWIFGKRSLPHVGMSGLVLGLFSFNVTHGLFAGGWITAVALLILLFFGKRMAKTLMNRSTTVSVSAHVWGFLSGIFAAYLISPFGPFSTL